MQTTQRLGDRSPRIRRQYGQYANIGDGIKNTKINSTFTTTRGNIYKKVSSKTAKKIGEFPLWVNEMGVNPYS